mmetsp:Transcript_33872/g.49800  ORF Transcript_33872/g.49800 Transcript_33872/m.49800 type:complete len:103 (+) Transcript_33872:169-477(+)
MWLSNKKMPLERKALKLSLTQDRKQKKESIKNGTQLNGSNFSILSLLVVKCKPKLGLKNRQYILSFLGKVKILVMAFDAVGEGSYSVLAKQWRLQVGTVVLH